MSNKLQYLRLVFGDTYIQCKEVGHSDWQLFVNSLDMLVKAVKEFEALPVESTLIKLGFSRIYNEQLEELKRMEESLKTRGMVK